MFYFALMNDFLRTNKILYEYIACFRYFRNQKVKLTASLGFQSFSNEFLLRCRWLLMSIEIIYACTLRCTWKILQMFNVWERKLVGLGLTNEAFINPLRYKIILDKNLV